jgi:methionine--tRNA ligase beta chain
MADSPQQNPQSPTTAPAAPVDNTIQYDDFAKLELRVATVVECAPHPNADKLLVLQIDLGGQRRQICAGLRQHYQPEQLVGKQIVVVANLAPRQMRGQVSQGMLLAASDAASGKVIVISPSDAVPAGSKVS